VGREDLLFPEDDVQGLADILERIVADSRFRDETIRHGLDRIDTMYTNEAVARGLLAAFEPILSRGIES
jgi:glycosyltransferase involved in cell wall biosynthesis